MDKDNKRYTIWILSITVALIILFIYMKQNVLNIVPIILFNAGILYLHKSNILALFILGIASFSQVISSITLGQSFSEYFSNIALEFSIYLLSLCIYSVSYSYKCFKSRDKFSIKKLVFDDISKNKVTIQARIISISLIVIALTFLIRRTELDFNFYNIAFSIMLIGNIIYTIWICLMAKDMYFYLFAYNILSILILSINLIIQDNKDINITIIGIITSIILIASTYISYSKYSLIHNTKIEDSGIDKK